MSINVDEIYSKISVYEETVRLTSDRISRNDVSVEVLEMVSDTVNKIERLNPRNSRWPVSTTAKSSSITA